MLWYDTSDTIPGPFLRQRNPYEKTLDEEENEGKQGVLKFANHEAYLDSLVLDEDVIRLESYTAARMVAALGCRHTGVTLTEAKLQRLQARLREKLRPKRRKCVMASEGFFEENGKKQTPSIHKWRMLGTKKAEGSRLSLSTLVSDSSLQRKKQDDALMRELAIREKANRMGVLATVIFIRHFNAAGHELSGYIDYGDRLESEKWEAYFEGSKKLMPNQGDLAFVHWKHGTATWKSSRNFRVILDPKRGVIFQHRHDRKTISTDPQLDSPGCSTVRVIVSDSGYEQVVLYDHLARKKL
ncbi:cilia- and flagella-associated protein 299-like [Hetaerina americana]|uniref:cilia- and flagella-associated protein 299-like n=1 Tax=Hetaerina americana TaxID=62018 RepID=UPI003A7F462F